MSTARTGLLPILGIDPGTDKSAHVLYLDGKILSHGISPNIEVLRMLSNSTERHLKPILAVEMIASYGMPVGREVFETCVWIGRFLQAWGGEYRMVYRRDVKLYLCNSSKAKDANVRQALLDLVGPQGTKKAPGPTYGLRGDEWAALGVAITAANAMLERRAA